MLVLYREYLRWNGIPMPSPGRVAAALKRFLVENPAWNSEQIERAIRNRFASDLNPADEPWVWLPYLARYVRGPLDKFSRPRRTAAQGATRESIDREIEQFNKKWEAEKAARRR